MKIELIRKDFAPTYTLGDILIDGKPECFCIEDRVREGEKVPGSTAIPYGRYQVVITMSNRFKRMLPLLLNVPGFEGIRIHPGNTEHDTEGCILPGTKKVKGAVHNSKLAFQPLFEKIQAALHSGAEVWIEVKKGIEHNYA